MTADIVPFSSAPQSTMAIEPNRASIARTVDQEITVAIERIEEYAKQLWRLIERMRVEELWRELGHATYRDYLATVSARASQVPKALRTPIRKQLEEAGASTREIAAATGTTKQTVINDRNREAGKTPRSNPAAAVRATVAHVNDAGNVVEAEVISDETTLVHPASQPIEPEPNCTMRDTVVRLEGIVQYIGTEAPPEVRIEVSKMLRREADRMDPRKPRNHATGRMSS